MPILSLLGTKAIIINTARAKHMHRPPFSSIFGKSEFIRQHSGIFPKRHIVQSFHVHNVKKVAGNIFPQNLFVGFAPGPMKRPPIPFALNRSYCNLQLSPLHLLKHGRQALPGRLAQFIENFLETERMLRCLVDISQEAERMFISP